MNEQYSALRSNVSMLGKVLGETIKDALGEHILERVETIRKLSKSSRAGNDANRQELLTTLQNLSNDELLPVARAFSQFLNLANTAEQYHSISPKGEAASNPEVIARTLRKLKNQPELSEDTIKKAVESLSLELVLTAHPTEITRRTLIHKMVEVNACLKQLDNKDIADYEHNQLMRRLRQLIAQSWHTDEIRKLRPSPVDEAKWGFAVVENSLWQGVPNYLRELNEQLEENLGYKLPVEFVPVRFTSWMGGDRDGNPNVTADITRHVLLLSRWKATDLFLKDIQVLVSELSMVEATPELLALVGEEGAAEPYRYLMKNLRSRLMATQAWLEARLKGEELPKPEGLLTQNEELWEPLYACYQSLQACGMGIIANGGLLDTLRRVKCFGVPLVRIGEHPPYRSAGRADPLPRYRRLRKLVRGRQTGVPDPRTELQTSASAAQLATKRRNARSARYLPGDCRSAARLHCRLRDLDGENAVRRAGCPPAAERSGYRVCNAGCSAV